jgi:hypothetical protein
MVFMDLISAAWNLSSGRREGNVDPERRFPSLLLHARAEEECRKIVVNSVLQLGETDAMVYAVRMFRWLAPLFRAKTADETSACAPAHAAEGWPSG